MPMGHLQSRQRSVSRIMQLERCHPNEIRWNDHATHEPRNAAGLQCNRAHGRSGGFKPAVACAHNGDVMFCFDAQLTADQMPPTAARMCVTVGDCPDGKGDLINTEREVSVRHFNRGTFQYAHTRQRNTGQQKPKISAITNRRDPCRRVCFGVCADVPLRRQNGVDVLRKRRAYHTHVHCEFPMLFRVKST